MHFQPRDHDVDQQLAVRLIADPAAHQTLDFSYSAHLPTERADRVFVERVLVVSLLRALEGHGEILAICGQYYAGLLSAVMLSAADSLPRAKPRGTPMRTQRYELE